MPPRVIAITTGGGDASRRSRLTITAIALFLSPVFHQKHPIFNGVDVPPPTMNAPLNLSQPAISQVIHQVLSSRRITRADQQCFMSAAHIDGMLSMEDQMLVNRVFDALKTGLLRVVD